MGPDFEEAVFDVIVASILDCKHECQALHLKRRGRAVGSPVHIPGADSIFLYGKWGRQKGGK